LALVFVLLALWALPTPSPAAEKPRGKVVLIPVVRVGQDAPTRSAFDSLYNGDYDRAIREFEQIQRSHPDDPRALNWLTSAVLFKELFRIGALDTDLYADSGFMDIRHAPVDPKVRARLRALSDETLALCERKLRANPNDVHVLYARGVARGTRALAVAMLDRSWIPALRAALGARHDHERVLQLDPNYSDAKLVLGVHYYVLGSLPWTIKVAASLIGLSGSKTKGMQFLTEAANGGGESNIDARSTLALFLRREQRYAEAIAAVDQLQQVYPRNFLIALERAHLLAASGQGQEAMAAYRRLLSAGRSAFNPGAPLEQAAYGLGEVLRGWHQYLNAAQAFDQVHEYPNVDPGLRVRASLQAGQMYDLLERRDLALKEYQQVLALQRDTPLAQRARKYIKEPYREMLKG
jgi:tetratricopeptide (TPR) repeat protein